MVSSKIDIFYNMGDDGVPGFHVCFIGKAGMGYLVRQKMGAGLSVKYLSMVKRLIFSMILGVGIWGGVFARGGGAFGGDPPCRPVHLRCEWLENPLGIDAAAPRLSWEMADSRSGAWQSWYSVVVGTDSVQVAAGKGAAWESGKVASDASLVRYRGAALRPFTKYYWRVVLGDAADQESAPAMASFEMGMMGVEHWRGTWISDGKDKSVKPAPYFRTEFSVGGDSEVGGAVGGGGVGNGGSGSAKKIVSARAYIAVAGLYELSINGVRIGDHRLDPMYTRFDRRVLYVTYDITTALREGANCVGVLLGNGWYNHQSTAVWHFDQAPWRERPTFCMDLRIVYSDGEVQTVTTGKNWKTTLSPVVFNSIYTGEHYDARRELPGWNTVGFVDTAWGEVYNRQAPAGVVVAQAMVPIRDVERIPAGVMTKLSDTDYVFSLVRNIAGVSRIRVSGEAGTVLRLVHGERLYKNGHVDQSNINVHYRPKDDTDPFQTDIYILKGGSASGGVGGGGDSVETFAPRFGYKGFQYIEVLSSRPVKLAQGDVEGLFMHSDVAPVGRIASDDKVTDKIWAATNNSYLSNLFGYPTDCPQREKNGWTGDAAIASETGLYNFDGITVYEKWLADHRDEQQPNGVLPSIIPTGGWGYEWGNGPDWTSTIAIIPWNLYLFYGDTTALARNYPNIRRYVDHIAELYPSGLCSWGLGDWIPVRTRTPVELTSTAYYYADVMILAKAAKLFGFSGDHERYLALAGKIKAAFTAKYWHPETAWKGTAAAAGRDNTVMGREGDGAGRRGDAVGAGKRDDATGMENGLLVGPMWDSVAGTGVYGEGSQTQLSVPLYWGLVPDSIRERTAAALARRVAADSFHLDVGLLGTKAILSGLSDNGYADIAWRLATQKGFPSWGWWIVNGATTLYENWPIDAKSDISLNHIMFGEIGAWLFKGPAGIRPDPAQPGFKHVLIEPHFVEGLKHFEGEHVGPLGQIRSSWRRRGKTVVVEVTVPPNSTATVALPGRPAVQVVAGSYKWTISEK